MDNTQGVSVSGLVISRDRPEVLVSYQGEQIYSFTTDRADFDHESCSFGGHINQATFLKNVAYWGPREEYVVSGGDEGIIWVSISSSTQLLASNLICCAR